MKSNYTKERNICLVSQVFYPNTQSTSLLLTDLALQIQNHCFAKVTVISGFPNGVDNHLVQYHENFQGIEIYRCGINVNLKAGLWQRLLSYISYLIHAAWKLLFYPHKDIIIGVSNPPFLSIILAIISMLTGCGYYFIMHDVYPEGLLAVSKLKEESVITKFWRNTVKLSYHKVKKIVVLGRDMKDLLITNYSIEPDRIACIPNWSLTSNTTFIPFKQNRLARELGIENKFVVQYSGNMGLWHDIDTFIRAADRLKDNRDIQFLFIGNGIRQKQAQELAQELELKNIVWMDFVPKEELSSSLTCAHVALISLNTGLEGIAVPCKLYGILASGRAIIAQVPKNSEIAYVVQEENCGFVVSPGNVEELVQKIEQLASDRSLVEEMGLRSFQAYQSKYTIEHITKQFQELLGL
jgi:glycosyltransferase involved in cell wall biosynthesis